jgi:large subunit ribosomal protein L28
MNEFFNGSDERGIAPMSKVCDVCGKRPQTGSIVSHAHNVSKTRRMPNLKTVKADVPGRSKRVTLCTRCLRSGKIRKSA